MLTLNDYGEDENWRIAEYVYGVHMNIPQVEQWRHVSGIDSSCLAVQG